MNLFVIVKPTFFFLFFKSVNTDFWKVTCVTEVVLQMTETILIADLLMLAMWQYGEQQSKAEVVLQPCKATKGHCDKFNTKTIPCETPFGLQLS